MGVVSLTGHTLNVYGMSQSCDELGESYNNNPTEVEDALGDDTVFTLIPEESGAISVSVDGDVTAPRIAIAEGAHFRGNVDMSTKIGNSTVKAEPKQIQPAKPESKKTAARAT